MSSAATPSTTHYSLRAKTLSRASGKKLGLGIAGAVSTPNLNTVFGAHSKLAPPLPAGSGLLARKASYAALTPGSLATIPDDSENYPYDTVLNDDDHPNDDPDPDDPASSPCRMGPLTPARGSAHDLGIGDIVDVPGNMQGTVRFVGSVAGRKGIFVGVELHPQFDGRGKNSGDVDGVSYFTTQSPGAGIFVPVSKLFKRESASSLGGTIPRTPSALKVASQNTTNFTPTTPSLPKFSQSVGPGRASPAGRKPRPSFSRPESPARKLQLTPAARTNATTPGPGTGPPRYGTPSINKFSASVRGTAGDPAKAPSRAGGRKPSFALPRSVSALEGASTYSDEDHTPPSSRTKTNGSISSISSLRMRAGSRAAAADTEEIERLKSQLTERDRQLKEQASALAEMESSVTELTSLMESSDMGQPRRDSQDDKDTSQLRALLREKNEKIAMLTAEFDVHRADFRSTIDTLELASTETQRVYDARIRELEQEIRELQERTDDVDSVARQLKQLEELVQELEEGLEDARRGEAEARGEVEFLRGEVERTRAELRKEREKVSTATNGNTQSAEALSMSKELEKKDDEIRGLKAIIHSLNRDSVPGSSPDKTPTLPQRNRSLSQVRADSTEVRLARDKLEREVSELRSIVDNKSNREEELERELEGLRRNSATTHRGSSLTTGSTEHSSVRDSKGTVILSRDNRPTEHKRRPTMETMAESDAYSSVTDSSALWCEMCETGGHDILTCGNMFGNQKDQPASKTAQEVARGNLPSLQIPPSDSDAVPPPLTRNKSPGVSPTPVQIKVLPNPAESGPLAGKESGVVDADKWCALCERDGHDSIDCPFEDAF